MFFLNKKMAEIRQKIMCSKEQHEWDGCKCHSCGKTRDEGHRWNGCMCITCGTTRDEGHKWDGCICTVCGGIRNEGHLWDCCSCKVCGEIKKIEDGLDYYSEKPDCPGCDCVAGTAEELLSYGEQNGNYEEEVIEKNICTLSTIRCSKCKRIILSSNETICFKNFKK